MENFSDSDNWRGKDYSDGWSVENSENDTVQKTTDWLLDSYTNFILNSNQLGSDFND
jgi:hypothetical protein